MRVFQPEELARFQRLFLEDIRDYPEKYSEAGQRYSRDILGNTPEQAEQFERALRQTFQDFKQLTDDYPIDLVAGVKDEICKGCTYGEHCTSRISEMRGVSMIEHDGAVVDLFTAEAKKLNLDADFRRITLQAAFSDSQPVIVQGIRTTKGTVNQVFHGSTIRWSEVYIPIAPLIRIS